MRYKLNIRQVLNGVNILNDFQNFDIEVSDIVYDSNKVKKNCMFVCLKGANFDGHNFANEAIQRGASSIVCQENLNLENQIIVKDTRSCLSKLSANFFENEDNSDLKIIGFTGTKGKTTSSLFIYKVLNDFGIKTAQIGTMGAIFGSEIIKTDNTTPESYEIQKFIRKAKNENFKAIVIEASSIGLKGHRLDNILFDYGVFTNLSNDHISKFEHHNIEDYIHSKSILFRKCKTGIINIDDPYVDAIIKGHTCNIQTVGFNKTADFVCNSYVLNEESFGSSFEINGKQYSLSIPGKFNIYNALSCVSVCSDLGIPYENIRDSLRDCKIKGRSEVIFKNKNFMVLVDYAHNGLSLKNILSSLKMYHPKRIVTLFGAGGNRAKSRRYSMGKVSGEFSDLSVISSDNSRFESTYDIISDIKEGILDTNGEFVIIPDRKEAICYCLKNAQRGDIILLAGKGHETTQETNGITMHFDEREIVKEYLYSAGVVS